MPVQDDFEDDVNRRREYGNPHSGKHPIPTIQGYREHRKEMGGQVQDEEQAQRGPEDESTTKRAFHSAKAIIQGKDDTADSKHNPYPATNHNYAERPPHNTSATNMARVDEPGREAQEADTGEQDIPDRYQQEDEKESTNGKQEGKGQDKTATEAVVGAVDPKEKRKAMKKTKRHGGGREVTDPITHLPITIHDQTDKDLKSAPENEPDPGTQHYSATGPQAAAKSDEELETEREKIQRGHNGMQKVFPPPDFEYTRSKLAEVHQKAIYAGLGGIVLLAAILFVLPMPFASRSSSKLSENRSSWLPQVSTMLTVPLFFGLAIVTVIGMGQWVNKRTNEIFDDETWDAARREEQAVLSNDEELPESTQWLNSLISAIWPLINPDLFASLVDQIEDVMQASLPKVIKMVAVDDMGQGSEALRILGVRWLPTGAASESVDSGGKLHKGDEASQNDRTDPQNAQEGAGDQDGDGGKASQSNGEDDGDSKQQEQEQIEVREGMEAEEGDFVNVELALAYRSRSSGKSVKSKAKNAHLLLKFYLPSGVAIPVWVELRGLIMTLRMRLQLTPDPPFISLCTLTFLGQPKASISCVPLSKHALSLTDVPLISSFVNSAVDAALAEYVAPKSLTLNLKDMLVGDDFKKDTTSIGVVWIYIKRARDFKQGDGGVGPMKGSSDAYVTVSWGKFGKPVASTRVVEGQNDPGWHEYASILVTPEEVNAGEKLRLQLWDSDKWSADDDLGRVELDLKTLMKGSETCNKIQDREDRFTGQDEDEMMPGSLFWSVGYFAKTRITQKQLEHQSVNDDIRTKDQLKEHVSGTAEYKLREAGKSPHDEEIKQQKAQDYKETEDSMIISAPPSDEFFSGILSVQVHNITGLEVQKLQRQDKGDGGDSEDEAEQTDDMPDSYCTIIMNHKKIFRTRTKPKNAKPFFNAGTERFVRDWRNTEIIVSVRDAREREDDPLIGLVYLPLAKVFAEKSQVMENYPLVGGIGYGRARISMVWRGVEAKLPPNLRGWEYGTLEIRGSIKAKEGLPKSLTEHRIKVRTNMGRAKMYPEDGQWSAKGKKGPEDVFLPVRKRYSSAMVIEFRESTLGPDRTPAFAVLWFHHLVDEQDDTKVLQVWKGSKEGLRRAEMCADYNGMEENEQTLGEIEVGLKFWRGLSGYHKGYAAKAKNGDLRQVMECLDTIADEQLDEDGSEGEGEDYDDDANDEAIRKKKLEMHTNDDSTPSNSDDEDDNGPSGSSNSSKLSLSKVKDIFRSPVDGGTTAATSILAPGHNNPDDGSRGIRSEMRDYKDHHKQMHRKHRGVMQWRAAREADHLGGKLTRLKGNISDIFHHSEKETGVETEI
ncbi:Uu.00g050610.m01.CDS01 [Anthostomella pinea]|uniref:Uu.00g050610.m01.CDS01 n=1 Tax=Anthostomella pinea TaxID=933095 RepID=A0AAI8VSR0_9PEZI|nr:Uu.00g050610.m01.CDS01 [Anthostomella pinea]